MPVSAGGRCGRRRDSGTRDEFESRQQRGRVGLGALGASPRRPRRHSTVPRPRATSGGSTRRPDATSTIRQRSARASGPSGRGASGAPAREARATSARPCSSPTRVLTAPRAAAGLRSPRASAAPGPVPGKPPENGSVASRSASSSARLATHRIPAAGPAAAAETRRSATVASAHQATAPGQDQNRTRCSHFQTAVSETRKLGLWCERAPAQLRDFGIRRAIRQIRIRISRCFTPRRCQRTAIHCSRLVRDRGDQAGSRISARFTIAMRFRPPRSTLARYLR